MPQEQLPHGFVTFRKAIGLNEHSYYKTAGAKQLRAYLKNSNLRFEKVQTYGQFGGSTYTEIITFCADGSFRYQNTNAVTIADGYCKDKSTVTGYWDAFTDQNLLFAMLYSNHPEITQHNTKGFIPMLVKSYDANAITIANEGEDKVYRKTLANCI